MFQPSSPVSDDAFFDRRDELQDLLTSIARIRDGAPTWVALLGQRRIGKSSLLMELQRRGSSDDMAIVVLDSLEFAPLGPDLLTRYALRVVDTVLGPRLGASLETLARRPAAYQRALQPILGELSEPLSALVLDLPTLGDDALSRRACLQLPEELAAALGIWITVAWDEFQAVTELRGRRGHDELLPLMRSLWQKHRRTTYVVSGSERSVLSEMLLSPHAPFFQHFTVRELGPLAETDAIDLLVRAAPEGREIPEELAQRAARLLHGHPFYLQLFGDELTRAEGPYDEQALKRTIQQLVFSRAGRLGLFFENHYVRLVGRATTLAATLAAVAERPGTLSDIARAIGAPTSAASRYLARVGDAVEREDGHWKISDPVFALWLRWREPGGAAVPMSVLGDEGERRAADHLAALGFDLVYQSRASRGAFDLLATRGPWQVGIQVKRRPLPLRFTAAEWTRMEADAARFGWRWLILAVSPEDESVVALDPLRATGASRRTLGPKAAVANLLAWVERPPR